jgi:hypothetical protein
MSPLADVLPMVTPDRIARRMAVKGVTLGAGAVVLQPFLNGLAAEARGEKPAPRIVFVIESNGLWDHHVRPATLGKPGVWNSPVDALVDEPLAGHALPEPIAPLEPFKDRMSVVLGLSGKHISPNHGAGCGALNNCATSVPGTRPLHMQTIDHALAGKATTPFPVLGLAVHPTPGTVFVSNASLIAPRRPLPLIADPNVAFRTLFGSVAGGDARKVFAARAKLLDHIRGDVRRVRDALPAMDREKLDIYLDSFDQMRARQDSIDAIGDQLRANRPDLAGFEAKRTTDRFKAQCAIAASALAARLTNVVVIDAVCFYSGYHHWTDLGVKIDGHAIGHMTGQPGREEHAVPVRRFHAERVADIATRLAAVKEGEGTLLDNTLIVWMSDAAEEHHGTGGQWPLVLVGNLGGRLKTGGRFLQYPGYGKQGHRTLGNFYLALLRAFGDERKMFGEADRGLAGIDTSGPLAEILA